MYISTSLSSPLDLSVGCQEIHGKQPLSAQLLPEKRQLAYSQAYHICVLNVRTYSDNGLGRNGHSSSTTTRALATIIVTAFFLSNQTPGNSRIPSNPSPAVRQSESRVSTGILLLRAWSSTVLYTTDISARCIAVRRPDSHYLKSG